MGPLVSVTEVMELIHRRVSEPTANVEHIYTKVGNKLRKFRWTTSSTSKWKVNTVRFK